MINIGYYIGILFIIFSSGIWLSYIFGKSIFKNNKLILAFLLGFLWLILFSSWSSYAGFSFVKSCYYLLGISCLLSLITLIIEYRNRTLHNWLLTKHTAIVLFLSFLSGIIVLSPMLIFKAFNPYVDAFTYLSISDYLLTHSYFDPAQPDANSPWLTQMKMYQVMGYRMGAQFFLSFIASIYNRHFSLDVYVPVLAVGQFMLVLAIWLFNKYVLKLANAALIIIVIFTSFHIGIPIQNSLFGFFPQSYGMVVIMLVFTFMTVALTNKTNSLQNILLSSLSIAVLIITYNELVPFAFLSLSIILIYLSIKQKNVKSLLLKSSVVIVITIIFSNIALVKAIQSVKHQLSAVVGWQIDYTLWDYVELVLSLHPIMYEAAFYNKYPFLNVILSIFTILIVVLIIKGFTEGKYKKELLYLICLSSSFLLVLFYFTYIAHNPWNTQLRGHSWSIYKTVQYLFVLIPSVIGLGLYGSFNRSSITKRLIPLYGLIFITLSMVITYYYDYVNTDQMRNFTGNKENPISEYYKLNEKLKNEEKPINIIMPDNLEKHKEMVLYILRDHVLVSDWSKDIYLNSMLDSKDLTPQLRKDGVTLVYKPNTQTGAANMEILGKSIYLDIVSGVHGLETNEKQSWYWSNGNVYVKAYNPYSTIKTLNLSFSIGLPPNIKEDKEIELLYNNNLVQKIKISASQTNSYNIDIPLDSGEGNIIFKYLGDVVKVEGDPRVFGFSLVNFQYSTKN
ncbi:hypothetical protein O9H85_09035 [Paenibacillus filicis]|uniref:Uncharacterized protein n=1 Tax=Paenibacillus gyeongsangnamensis TaxID=3388067 RepID=A0ABT4Q6Z6_9BACL|nr:hypothetical protein [Paenibacillus filicis]MCZ8512557.1 hypothetical protein [Paenibacillus filicis]